MRAGRRSTCRPVREWVMRFLLAALLLVPLTTACGSSDDGPTPAGPDVQGFALPDARASLDKAGVRAVVRLVEGGKELPAQANEATYVVCDVNYIGQQAVEVLVNAGKCPD
jgi:hypothetical protein